jgi:three-Cys-motif partner protein
MARRKNQPSFDPLSGELFPDAPGGVAESVLTFSPANRVLWTETKAKLIEAYIKLFLLVTRHGIYIDAFAGPQYPDHPDKWAAKLVANLQPDYLNHIFLCDYDEEKYQQIQQMLSAISPLRTGKKRRTKLHAANADCNTWIDQVLSSGAIKPATAVFCLLDQHTHEAHWATVQKLANFKKSGHKIEIFYFLATGWLQRVLKSRVHTEVLDLWWGDQSWVALKGVQNSDVPAVFCQRFKDEFGYKLVYEWPIYKEASTGQEMYRMIHATDHPRAPLLMHHAYRIASGLDSRSAEQIVLDLRRDETSQQQ